VTELSGFQQEIARLFFSLQSSHGFVLAGGGALLASGLSNRPTQDLDFFGSPGQVSVSLALGQLLDAIQQQNWDYELLGHTNDFARVRIIGSAELIVDLAVDVAPRFPVAQTPIGPVFCPMELAGRKLLALFDRAEARDFVDVYVLSMKFGNQKVFDAAAQIEVSLDKYILARMMNALERFSDDELPTDRSEVGALREHFAEWAKELNGA
jgi:predicted nucleotidyltransferase component of viral defense system